MAEVVAVGVIFAAGAISVGIGCDADAREGDEVLEDSRAGWTGKRGGDTGGGKGG